jgi:hypothetical protein
MGFIDCHHASAPVWGLRLTRVEPQACSWCYIGDGSKGGLLGMAAKEGSTTNLFWHFLYLANANLHHSNKALFFAALWDQWSIFLTPARVANTFHMIWPTFVLSIGIFG